MADRRGGCLVALVLALGCAGTAPRPPPPPRPPRPPAVRDADLAWFVGSWTARAEDPSSGRAFRMSYRVEPVLGGEWLEGNGDAPEIGLRIRDLWGRDPVDGDLVRAIFQSDGTWGSVRAKGWEGDVLLFEGEARSELGATRVRETIRRTGASEFHAVWEMEVDGEWRAYSVERLVRDPPRGDGVGAPPPRS